MFDIFFNPETQRFHYAQEESADQVAKAGIAGAIGVFQVKEHFIAYQIVSMFNAGMALAEAANSIQP